MCVMVVVTEVPAVHVKGLLPSVTTASSCCMAKARMHG